VATPPRACVVKKFIFQDPDVNVLADIRRRFEKEARALERLGKDHNQIPSLYAFDTGGTEGYFVQEYVEGQNLAEFVQREGPMPEPKVLGGVLIKG
jgi:serine/threonine-protein kinase